MYIPHPGTRQLTSMLSRPLSLGLTLFMLLTMLLGPRSVGLASVSTQKLHHNENTSTSAAISSGLIAFSDYSGGMYDIYTMNADGSNRTKLTDNMNASNPAWSPDGKHIAFDAALDQNFPTPGLFIMNADGSGMKQLTNCCAIEPSWSPDGTRIAFTSGFSHADHTPDIYVMNSDGTNTKQLTTLGGSEPNWSPDGTHIVFASHRDCAPDVPVPCASIYIMNADGSDQTKLHDFGFTPAWSPDGMHIAFDIRTDDYSGGGIYIMNADGSNVIEVPGTSHMIGAHDPSWSPDSTYIAFDALPSASASSSSIYTIKTDGTNLTVLGQGGKPAWSAGSGCQSSPSSNLSLTITQVSDNRNNVAYLPNISGRGIVDGNLATAMVKIENCGMAAGQGTLSIVEGTTTLASMSQTINFNGAKEVPLSFSSKDMAWDRLGNQKTQHTLTARFTYSQGEIVSVPISFVVRPRPVVLVHGYNDTSASWATYTNSFLPSVGLKGYATDGMNTGGGRDFIDQLGWTTATIDQNAQRLKQFIANVKDEEGAEQVDVVAHSMGGLITRRYIAKYMRVDSPDINQLIMLGTPNEGSASTVFVAGLYLWPATWELTPPYLLAFNLDNTERRGVKFYAVAGNYFCLDPFAPAPVSNPIELAPNDVIVWAGSVFAIPLDGGWQFPKSVIGTCTGRHEWMRSNEHPYQGGKLIFDTYVSPLLRGVTPTESQSQTQRTSGQERDDVIEVGDPQAAYDALSTVQATAMQTATLKQGGGLRV